MVASAISASSHSSLYVPNRASSSSFISRRSSARSIVSFPIESPKSGLFSGNYQLPQKMKKDSSDASIRHGAIQAAQENPSFNPVVMTPDGALDLETVLFRNRMVFIGQPISSSVAQRAISQLMTLAALDDNADIMVYLNCPGGSIYSIFAIYDCMAWIKPKVGTVCFGITASNATILLAGGEKGMRYAMPNARIMVHQLLSGCGGHVDDIRRQVDEATRNRNKVDEMYAAFSGQPLKRVKQFTDEDRYLSAAEAMEFGLIDGIMETLY